MWAEQLPKEAHPSPPTVNALQDKQDPNWEASDAFLKLGEMNLSLCVYSV